ncbi:hypothetical protein M0811_03578 [Anaeramoeba ignava]|uniref:Uncharacterized protein n=1 Tax=Anaeramoeba ignava TaxID=1746090 RepID=A0A9Q0L7J5_ANAIG|nr:hypothetical protein M0811_03578 [Anaeramoeba ignava]
MKNYIIVFLICFFILFQISFTKKKDTISGYKTKDLNQLGKENSETIRYKAIRALIHFDFEEAYDILSNEKKYANIYGVFESAYHTSYFISTNCHKHEKLCKKLTEDGKITFGILEAKWYSSGLIYDQDKNVSEYLKNSSNFTSLNLRAEKEFGDNILFIIAENFFTCSKKSFDEELSKLDKIDQANLLALLAEGYQIFLSFCEKKPDGNVCFECNSLFTPKGALLLARFNLADKQFFYEKELRKRYKQFISLQNSTTNSTRNSTRNENFEKDEL